jgi:hypothetical protein
LSAVRQILFIFCRDRLYGLMRGSADIPKGKDPKLEGKIYHKKPFCSKVIIIQKPLTGILICHIY